MNFIILLLFTFSNALPFCLQKEKRSLLPKSEDTDPGFLQIVGHLSDEEKIRRHMVSRYLGDPTKFTKQIVKKSISPSFQRESYLHKRNNATGGNAPTVSAPTASAPTTSAPTVSTPNASAPTASAPTASAPTVSAPTVSAPNASAPTASVPTTSANNSAGTSATGKNETFVQDPLPPQGQEVIEVPIKENANDVRLSDEAFEQSGDSVVDTLDFCNAKIYKGKKADEKIAEAKHHNTTTAAPALL